MQSSEYHPLKTALANESSETLAELIVDLALTEENVYDAALALTQRKTPEKLIQTLRKQLEALRTGKTDYNYKNAHEFDNKLWHLLDSIKKNLSPEAPQATLDLLGEFFEADCEICERSTESDDAIHDVYQEAAKLFSKVAERLNQPPQAREWLQRLLQKNDYGVRDHLFDNAGRILKLTD